MTLVEYDNLMLVVSRLQKMAEMAEREAGRLEMEVWKAAGIQRVARDPGFACWRHDSLPGWHEGPRAVVAALESAARTGVHSTGG